MPRPTRRRGAASAPPKVRRTTVVETLGDGRMPPRIEEYDDVGDDELDPMSRTLDTWALIGKEEALQKVTVWCERVLESPDSETAGGVTFELRPVGLGKCAAIDTFTVQRDEDPATVADMIVDRACEDGKSLDRGKGRYAVTARGLPAFGRRGFTIEFGRDEDDDMENLPDHRGFVALTMEHAHESHDFAMKTMREMLQFTRQERHENIEEMRELRKGAIESLQMMGEVYRARHEREIEIRKMERADKRLDEIGGFLMAGGPALLNRIVGEKVMKEPVTPLEHQTEGFLRTFGPEQFQQALASKQLTLGPEQMIAFFELLKSFQEKAAAREAPKNPPAGEAAAE